MSLLFRRKSVARAFVLTIAIISASLGVPLKWRNVHMNVTMETDDPDWKELIMMWSNKVSDEKPLLTKTGPDNSELQIPAVDTPNDEILGELEPPEVPQTSVITSENHFINQIVNRTMRFLRVNYIKECLANVGTNVGGAVSKMAESCFTCRIAIGFLLHYIRKRGKKTDDVRKLSYKFCTRLNIQTPQVCDGITRLFAGEFTHVFQRTDMGSGEICSFLLSDACGPMRNWKVTFPPVSKLIATKLNTEEVNQPVFKVLQLSDTHFDPNYVEGTNAVCDEPLCCRLTNGIPKKSSHRAGRWGDYRNCDTPQRTINHMLQHISSTHRDIDFIIWTGDLLPHDVWVQNPEENFKIFKQTIEQMNSYFPGVPIFPALGNHESSPVNSFPPPSIKNEFSINWLYEEVDKQWSQWLPKSSSKTIRYGAFYSVLVRPGFRIISLNTNYCNNKNWWLLLNTADPANELEWFIYELQSAELNDEKVHVIGHIPPGYEDCLKVWSRNYYEIVARYESTITAQFFGHTHFDEFKVFYDPKDLQRPLSVSYISPSVTPFIDLNPGYRIYYIDGDRNHSTRGVLDYETWVMNLDEANLTDNPIWYKLYSAKDAYQLPSLMPQDWDNLIRKFADNKELFDTYYKHYWKNSPVRPTCDSKCKKRMIYDLRSGHSFDRKASCSEEENKNE